LANNEWIHFVPKREGITILCGDRPPIDIVVSGIGKLGINANCKGFGKSAVSDPFHPKPEYRRL
jgi:hypothetical protein